MVAHQVSSFSSEVKRGRNAIRCTGQVSRQSIKFSARKVSRATSFYRVNADC
jgi:hypothetical protein